MIVEISVAVIAAAFVALVIYMIILILTLRKTLIQVDQALYEVRNQIESLDSVFNTVSNIGDILEQRTASLKEEVLASSLRQEAKQSTLASLRDEWEDHSCESKVADILELAGLGIRLWQKLKERR